MSDLIAPLGPIQPTTGRHSDGDYILYTAAEEEARMRAHGGIPAVIRGKRHRYNDVVMVIDRADREQRQIRAIVNGSAA